MVWFRTYSIRRWSQEFPTSQGMESQILPPDRDTATLETLRQPTEPWSELQPDTLARWQTWSYGKCAWPASCCCSSGYHHTADTDEERRVCARARARACPLAWDPWNLDRKTESQAESMCLSSCLHEWGSSRRRNFLGLRTRPRPLHKCSLSKCCQQCYSAVAVDLSSGVLRFLGLP